MDVSTWGTQKSTEGQVHVPWGYQVQKKSLVYKNPHPTILMPAHCRYAPEMILQQHHYTPIYPRLFDPSEVPFDGSMPHGSCRGCKNLK